jgi:hypothetical protein
MMLAWLIGNARAKIPLLVFSGVMLSKAKHLPLRFTRTGIEADLE